MAKNKASHPWRSKPSCTTSSSILCPKCKLPVVCTRRGWAQDTLVCKQCGETYVVNNKQE